VCEEATTTDAHTKQQQQDSARCKLNQSPSIKRGRDAPPLSKLATTTATTTTITTTLLSHHDGGVTRKEVVRQRGRCLRERGGTRPLVQAEQVSTSGFTELNVQKEVQEGLRRKP
jgi:hypothetical protein